MSIISSYLIFLLLCISFQASYPKSLHHSVDSKFQKKLEAAPIKGRLGKRVVSWDKPAAIESKCMKDGVEEREIVKSKRRKHKIKIRPRRTKQLKRSLEVKKVPWRVGEVHHKKLKGNNNNGVFTSDYEHARTHPPSHN